LNNIFLLILVPQSGPLAEEGTIPMQELRPIAEDRKIKYNQYLL